MNHRIATIILIVLSVTACLRANAASPEATVEGKRIVVIGDSYVQNHMRPWSESWHARVAQKLGMYYLNFGLNGNCIAFDRTDEGFGEPLTERYLKLPDKADYILIIAGHNDAYIVGENPEKMSVFRDCLEKLLSGLEKRYPDASIGYVLPWHVDKPGFEEVIAEINEACGRHSIPVFDAGSKCAIDVNNDEFRKKYFQNKGINDKAHLNYEGHTLVVGKGIEFIKSL